MPHFSSKSLAKLQTCHSELQFLAHEVIKIHDCTVVYGHRGEKKQNKLYAEGKSKLKYPNSKHNSNPSIAIDLVPYLPGIGATWDREYILYFSGIVLGVAASLYKESRIAHKIRWGGSWSTDIDRDFKKNRFFDAAHFELQL